MLVVTPLGPTAVPYYFRGQGAGRWVGTGSELLGLAGVVERSDLVALLRGCDPGDGHFLPAWKPSRRRAGWDLTLGAPKSVSLLGASAAAGGDEIRSAHRAAVEEVVGNFERRLLALRRAGAPGGRVVASGLIGAAFQHRLNGSGEPHVHTHLLVCNLGRDPDGVWSALDREWWTSRRALGAIYQLGLRHHLRARGLDLDWRLREDGLADLVGVPRAAVRSASGRSRAAAADRASVANQAGGRQVGLRSRATIQTRRSAVAQPWQARAAAAGFGPDDADRMIVEARSGRGRPDLAGVDLAAAVTSWLSSQRSSFRQTDVLVALAACAPGGFSAGEAERWTERFCEAAIPVRVAATWAPRWTTPAAEVADCRLVDRAQLRRALRPASPRPLPDAPVEAEVLTAAAFTKHPGLSPPGRAAVGTLITDCDGLHILAAPPGRTNLLAQAAVVEAAGSGWRAAGRRVVVATSSEQAAARWHTLTGLAACRGVTSDDVVIIDHADRRGTPELLILLSDIDRRGATAVLVEGGTSARLGWMRSDGFTRLGDRQGRLDPGPPPAWAEQLDAGGGQDAPALGVTGCPSSTAAAGRLLATWADSSWSTTAGPVLVGLGYAEADGLNRAAREVLVRRGAIAGPALASGGRVFQAGDRAIALRRIQSDIPGGSGLQVVAVDDRRSQLTVVGAGRTATLDRHAAAHLGYGYAVTPALVAHTHGPLLMLGPPEALGSHRARVAAAVVVAAERDSPTRRRSVGWDRDVGLAVS